MRCGEIWLVLEAVRSEVRPQQLAARNQVASVVSLGVYPLRLRKVRDDLRDEKMRFKIPCS